MSKFSIGDKVRKTKGSQWKGTVVGTYSTTMTPEGYAVESDTERGSVQIYPAAALESVEPGIVPSDDDILSIANEYVMTNGYIHVNGAVRLARAIIEKYGQVSPSNQSAWNAQMPSNEELKKLFDDALKEMHSDEGHRYFITKQILTKYGQHIPQGWQLVPKEPTEEMIQSANQGDREYTDRVFGEDMETIQQGPYDHYKAMIAAAPQPGAE